MPGLQGLQDRLPRQRGHGDVQGGVPRPALPAPAAPACRLRHRLAARGGGVVARTRTATAINARHLAPAGGASTHPGSPGWRTDRSRRSRRRPSSSGGRRRVPARRTPTGRPRAARVLLWPDTFTNHFHPRDRPGRRRGPRGAPAGRSRSRPEPLCCGLTWISTGQLGVARRVLRRTIAAARAARARRWSRARSRAQLHGGLPLRPARALPRRPGRAPAEGPHGHARRAAHRAHRRLGAAPRVVRRRGDRPGALPPARGHEVGRRPRPARQAGVDVERLDSGCCGLAGNFGFTAGHGEVSRALAEQTLLPAIREADDDTVVLADGFSCRTQIHDLDSGGREGVHLAELLADLLQVDQDVTSHPEEEHHEHHRRRPTARTSP